MSAPPLPAAETELATLYETARALLGARDETQIASRLVLSGMGSLGARSGALLRADSHGRYRLLYAAGLGSSDPPETLAVPSAAREWALREGSFALATPAAARALGPVRDRLVRDYDGAIAAALADAQGLLGLLAFGPRLLPEDYGAGDLSLLESLASLVTHAFGARSERGESRARAVARNRPARTLVALRVSHPALKTMVGEGPALLETCQDLVAVAGTRFPVLLTGETGSGKELAARAIHDLSERASGPFEIVDCGSIPTELIESELFGHVRGAFTGAHRDRRGAFELAHRGTLFLDEIGEMPLQLQTRLLRVLQEARFRRVGDERMIEVDVRVVAATNRELKREVAERRFREDLFYRLNVFTVRIPPLRERREDLATLLRYFLARQAKELGVRSFEIDDETLEALATHTWPGNVRELANLVAGLAVAARDHGIVTLADLDPVWRRQHPGERPPWDGVARARENLGPWVLAHVRGSRFNLIEAARLLAKRKRQGLPVALTERSALSYYLTGEILRALADERGDVSAAVRTVAGDEDLERRVRPRVEKIVAVLGAARDPAAARRRFGKLPSEYFEALDRAHRVVAK